MTQRAVEAVLFDVDFTLARPGPDLGPHGYARMGSRYGLTLDPALYDDARLRAIETLERHPELDHDEALWIAFTERIVRGMGGDGAGAHECALAMMRAWEQAEHFELYDDVLPTLETLRGHGVGLGLVSNTGRDLDAFVRHHGLDVDVAVGSRGHGKTKPHPSIFLAVLERLEVAPEAAAMVGDSPEDDLAGARALGMRALLVDREDRFPDEKERLRDLRELPAALGLVPGG